MIAVQTGRPPRFPRLDYFIAQPISDSTSKYNYRQESPLYGCGDFRAILKHHQDLEAIITIMKKMWTITQTIDSKGNRNDPTGNDYPQDLKSFITEPRPDYTSPLLTLPLVSNCTDPTHNHIFETLCSAGVIYSRVLTQHTADFPNSPNNQSLQQLSTAFGKCSHDDFWVHYPGILLWVLLVGTATARGNEQAAYWMFYLSRTGAYTSVEGQMAGGIAIRRFLDIQRWIRERPPST